MRVASVKDGQIVTEEVPALTAINMRLRDDYIRDAAGGVGRWNKIIAKGRDRVRTEAAARRVSPPDRRVFADGC